MLHFQLKGTMTDGVPLVLLHGFLESLSMWEVLNLDEKHPCLSIDLPGHGASSLLLTEPISMGNMAILVKDVIDSQGLEEYWVIGHSMGGYVALELAEMDPNCSRVVLLNSNMWSDSPQKRIDRTRVAELVLTKKSAFIHEVIPNLFENPVNFTEAVEDLIVSAKKMESYAIAASSIGMSQRKDFTSKVKKGTIQPFVIQGKNDHIADYEQMNTIMASLQEQFFVVNSGHMAHFEATKEVTDLLSKILPKKKSR